MSGLQVGLYCCDSHKVGCNAVTVGRVLLLTRLTRVWRATTAPCSSSPSPSLSPHRPR